MPQAVAAIAVFFSVSTATVILVGQLILLAGSLAYSSVQAKAAKKKAKQQFNAAQVDRLQNVVSTIEPRHLVLGRVRKGGAVFYRATTAKFQQDFYIAIALAGHEIDGIESFFLDDRLVTLDGSGFVQEAPWNSTQTISKTSVTFPTEPDIVAGSIEQILIEQFESFVQVYSYQVRTASSHVQIFTHMGQSGQLADAALRAAFPADWLAANVVQGVAYVVVKLIYSETAFPTGTVNVTAVIRGAKLFDPRTGLTVWSENPALMIRHVYTHQNFGKSLVSAAEETRFIAAANASDTSTVYTVDGVAQPARALYKGSLVLPFGTTPKDSFDDLSQAMGGVAEFAGGEIFLRAGVYTAPVMDLTEADLAVVDVVDGGQSPISISVHRERAQKFNTVKITIWDAGQDYKQTDLKPLVGTALKTRDGAELIEEITMPAVGYAPQAQHIAGITMRDARDPMTVNLPFKLRAYPLELFDVITLTLPRYGWTAKQFMILERAWESNGSISLTLKETSAAITQMDAGFLAQGFAANTNLPKPWEIQSVGTLSAFSGTTELMKQRDGTVVSRLRIVWPQSTDFAVLQNGTIEVQYRKDSDDWSSVVLPGAETQAIVADVKDGSAYLIRARAKTTLAVSDWNLQITHTIIGKTEPPPPFDVFLVLAQPDGTRQYNFYYDVTSPPIDWQGSEIRYTPGVVSNPDWALMTPLQDGTTFYTASPIELNAPLSGTWTFSARSRDTSGNLSTAKTVSITLTKRRTGNTVEEFFEELDDWPGTLAGFVNIGGVVSGLGPELITNGTFAADTVGWTSSGSTVLSRDTTIFTNGGLKIRVSVNTTSMGASSVAFATIPGRSYVASADMYAPSTNFNSNTATLSTLSNVGIDPSISAQITSEGIIQNVSFTFVAVGTTTQIYALVLDRDVAWGAINDVCYVDNVSVKEIKTNNGWLEALNTGTWSTIPTMWDTPWGRWVMSPTTPAVYTTLAHDLGITLAGQIAADVVADGLATLELRTGADGVAWSAWGSASGTFSARWVQLRVTLSATAPQPVPVLHKLDYSVVAELKTEYINDVVPAGLLGALRIGVGDIRIPLGNTYILIKRSNTTIQDSRAGQWTDQRIDNALTGPRWQFKLDGVLTDPAFVDFYIEGF